jgi:hypothetical protein
MKKAVQNLWAELSKGKKDTNLSSEKREVKLNVVQEIENSRSFLNDAVADVSYMVDEYLPDVEKQLFKIRTDLDNFLVNSNGSAIEDAYDELQTALGKLEENAKALGMDANDIYDEFDQAEDELSDSESYVNSWGDMEKNFDIVFRLTNLK